MGRIPLTTHIPESARSGPIPDGTRLLIFCPALVSKSSPAKKSSNDGPRVTEQREGYERDGPSARRAVEVLSCGPVLVLLGHLFRIFCELKSIDEFLDVTI